MSPFRPAFVLRALAPLLGIFLSPLAAHADFKATHAFMIAKDQNQNLVQYDARLDQDCNFDRSEPFDIYWLIWENDAKLKRESLSFLERGLYGLDYHITAPREMIADVRVFKSRRIAVIRHPSEISRSVNAGIP